MDVSTDRMTLAPVYGVITVGVGHQEIYEVLPEVHPDNKVKTVLHHNNTRNAWKNV